jgi:hypothetical protein
MKLMQEIRDSISSDTFPDFCREFMRVFYKERMHDGRNFGLNKDDGKEDSDPGKCLNEDGYPVWVFNALASVGIELK